MQQSERNAHPPNSKENLNKLKEFNMSEKYCKKENIKVELPNCCICLEEISLGEKSILLFCGHMFHSNCIVTWLKKNNTCPCVDLKLNKKIYISINILIYFFYSFSIRFIIIFLNRI